MLFTGAGQLTIASCDESWRYFSCNDFQSVLSAKADRR